MCLNSPLVPNNPIDEALGVKIQTSGRMINFQGEVVRILAEKLARDQNDAMRAIFNRECNKVAQAWQ